MKKLALFLTLLLTLFAEQSMISKKDFVDFYLSSEIKEQIKKELRDELNISLEGAKQFLSEAIKEESEKHRKLYYTQTEEFARELASLKEEVNFLRELVVDANYQRNSNNDQLMQIKSRFDELENRIKEIEKKDPARKEEPAIPEAGQKL